MSMLENISKNFLFFDYILLYSMLYQVELVLFSKKFFYFFYFFTKVFIFTADIYIIQLKKYLKFYKSFYTKFKKIY